MPGSNKKRDKLVLENLFLNENIIKCYFPNTCINYNYMNIATFFE